MNQGQESWEDQQRPDKVAIVLNRRPYQAARTISMLMRQGLSVTERPFDEHSLELIRQLDPALILFVVDAADTRDCEIVHAIRAQTDAVILLVVARFNVPGILEALDAGADLYLRESDTIAILEATVRSVLRLTRTGHAQRSTSGTSEVVGDLILHPVRRMVECQGRSVQLTAMEFAILSALASSPGRVMSPGAILVAAGIPEPSTSAVSQLKVHVLRMRRKLREVCPAHEHILNLRGTGYMLERRGQDS
ncbi:MAG: winged helix-turn-helix domain-containing protein [Dehalococcoidia bacterium]|nr:winged helix-turn-helix domain-containing protein [Dehalococcoidia bacterium]